MLFFQSTACARLRKITRAELSTSQFYDISTRLLRAFKYTGNSETSETNFISESAFATGEEERREQRLIFSKRSGLFVRYMLSTEYYVTS